MNVEQSFEKFLGRRYDPAEVDLSGAVGTVERPSRTKPTAAPLETPLQAFQRLRVEVDALKSDLARLDEKDAKWLGSFAAVDGAGQATKGVWPTIREGIASIEAALEEISHMPQISMRLAGQYQVSIGLLVPVA